MSLCYNNLRDCVPKKVNCAESCVARLSNTPTTAGIPTRLLNIAIFQCGLGQIFIVEERCF